MKEKLTLLICSLWLAIGINSCKTAEKIAPVNAYTNLETVVISQNGDGTLTLRAWGQGIDKSHAIEQAKKNAVNKVIFNGFTGGLVKGAERSPILTEVNARERYDYYFTPFFRDGGEYKNFVQDLSADDSSRYEANAGAMKNFGVVVKVDRAALRQKLINDGIMKP